MKNLKTNAMRAMERAKLGYRPVYYDLGDKEFSGAAVSELTGIPESQSFKTLTAGASKRGTVVFVVPVNRELDLKKAARAAGDKRVELLKLSELLPVTGYERGGVSPVGMKKPFPVFIDELALEYAEIAISGGKKGITVLVDPQGLANMLKAEFADLCSQASAL